MQVSLIHMGGTVVDGFRHIDQNTVLTEQQQGALTHRKNPNKIKAWQLRTAQKCVDNAQNTEGKKGGRFDDIRYCWFTSMESVVNGFCQIDQSTVLPEQHQHNPNSVTWFMSMESGVGKSRINMDNHVTNNIRSSLQVSLIHVGESVVNGFRQIDQSTVLSEQQQHDPN